MGMDAGFNHYVLRLSNISQSDFIANATLIIGRHCMEKCALRTNMIQC